MSTDSPKFSQADLDRVAEARVFFGHQSVGANILDGVKERLSKAPAGWTDQLIGQNMQPDTKIAAFKQLVLEGPGRDARFAFMKLCYIDFDAGTDEAALFGRYKRTMQELSAARPGTTFIHVTTPLTTIATGPKAWLKRKLGAAVYGERENQKRARYNQALRAEYAGKAPVFDLAAIEADEPAQPQRFELDGALVPMLAPYFTDDGGHLNELGRRRAADRLLALLLQLLGERSS